jgi:hypothetical protein
MGNIEGVQNITSAALDAYNISPRYMHVLDTRDIYISGHACSKNVAVNSPLSARCQTHKTEQKVHTSVTHCQHEIDRIRSETRRDLLDCLLVERVPRVRPIALDHAPHLPHSKYPSAQARGFGRKQIALSPCQFCSSSDHRQPGRSAHGQGSQH